MFLAILNKLSYAYKPSSLQTYIAQYNTVIMTNFAIINQEKEIYPKPLLK